MDDQSTDRTAAILAELAARIPKLKILHTRALPPGWVGKNYAVTLAADVAQGDWLLFTDADTCHMPGSTRRALADAVDHNAVLVSYSPEQELGSFWERVLIPFVYCRLSAKFSFARVNDPKLPDAAANGQFLMILRDVYQKVGGHAAIAGEVLEDVALARRVKQAGYQIYFTAPIGIDPHTDVPQFSRALGRMDQESLPADGRHDERSVLRICQGFSRRRAHRRSSCSGRCSEGRINLRSRCSQLCCCSRSALRCARFAEQLYRNLYPLSYIKYYVPGMCLYSAALIASWWKNTRGSVQWKGRTYPAGAQPMAQKPLPQRTQ